MRKVAGPVRSQFLVEPLETLLEEVRGATPETVANFQTSWVGVPV